MSGNAKFKYNDITVISTRNSEISDVEEQKIKLETKIRSQRLYYDSVKVELHLKIREPLNSHHQADYQCETGLKYKNKGVG